MKLHLWFKHYGIIARVPVYQPLWQPKILFTSKTYRQTHTEILKAAFYVENMPQITIHNKISVEFYYKCSDKN